MTTTEKLDVEKRLTQIDRLKEDEKSVEDLEKWLTDLDQKILGPAATTPAPKKPISTGAARAPRTFKDVFCLFESHDELVKAIWQSSQYK